MAKVSLRTIGNPDFNQDPNKPLWGIPDGWATVRTLREASKACQDFLDKYGLGSGNWAGGEVYDESGKWVARVSYNGRVWPPKPWESGDDDISGDLLDLPIDEARADEEEAEADVDERERLFRKHFPKVRRGRNVAVVPSEEAEAVIQAVAYMVGRANGATGGDIPEGMTRISFRS